MMRPDQLAQLNDLAERLADVFIVEADPNNWSGAGQLPADMDPQTRGNRHWDRKGAMGTGGVLNTTLNLMQHWGKGGPGDGQPDGDLDDAISDAEKRAKQALARVMNKAQGKAKFDAKTLGKVHGKG